MIEMIQLNEKLINSLVNDHLFDATDKQPIELESTLNSRKVIKMENLSRFDIVKSRLY